LLYGPPGTGKAPTVRHLLVRTPKATTVLLTGTSVQFITRAAELARAMQPAIVVLEGDSEVTFILTTNRVQVLERALAERPGRQPGWLQPEANQPSQIDLPDAGKDDL